MASQAVISIYIVHCSRSAKKYVGATHKTVIFRLGQLLSESRGTFSMRPIARAIRRYGVKAFSVELLAVATGRAQADSLERKYIFEFGTWEPFGWNAQSGGKSDFKISKVARLRMARAIRAATARRGPDNWERISQIKAPRIRPWMRVDFAAQ